MQIRTLRTHVSLVLGHHLWTRALRKHYKREYGIELGAARTASVPCLFLRYCAESRVTPENSPNRPIEVIVYFSGKRVSEALRLDSDVVTPVSVTGNNMGIEVEKNRLSIVTLRLLG